MPMYMDTTSMQADIDRMTRDAIERRDNLIALINTWNEATSPYTLRSDKEHAIERTRAKCAMSSIKRNYTLGVDYKELSSGALWPMECV